MDYAEYASLAGKASELEKAGQCEAALAIFEGLAETDIAILDRAAMRHNAALMHERLGRADAALASYDAGIALEAPLCRSTVAEQKGACLHRLGRNAECLALYRELLARPWATEEEKYRFRYNIGALGG